MFTSKAGQVRAVQSGRTKWGGRLTFGKAGEKLIIMEITALLHDCSLDGETGYAATCVEFPEANGQGETVGECMDNLRSAVSDVLSYRHLICRKPGVPLPNGA